MARRAARRDETCPRWSLFRPTAYARAVRVGAVANDDDAALGQRVCEHLDEFRGQFRALSVRPLFRLAPLLAPLKAEKDRSAHVLPNAGTAILRTTQRWPQWKNGAGPSTEADCGASIASDLLARVSAKRVVEWRDDRVLGLEASRDDESDENESELVGPHLPSEKKRWNVGSASLRRRPHRERRQ